MKSRKSLFIFFPLFVLFSLHCAKFKTPTFTLTISTPERIQRKLSKLFSAQEFRNAFWGVVVEEGKSGSRLFSLNAEKGFMPASNLKLYTTAAALVLLGPDYRYETKIYYHGKLDETGVLDGDIIIKGSGDPSISERYRKDISLDKILTEWAEALSTKGIRQIKGDIIGDDDCFDDQEIEGTWENDDLSFWYATGSSGLAIADNCFSYEVSAADTIGDFAIINLSPQTHYITVINDVITTSAVSRSFVEVYRQPNTNTVRFWGRVAFGSMPVKHFASVHNGTLYTLHLFAEKLKNLGIAITGELKDVDEFSDKLARIQPQRWRLIHTHYSPPLSELIRIVNKHSQNFYADMLLKTLGYKFSGVGSFITGGKVVKEFLYSIGMPEVDEIVIHDGSGLSRRNLIQPRQTAYLLRYMINHKYGEYFYDSLPIAGVDGTLRRRMKNTPAAGNVHAKTGFITRARCLSGYVNTAKGRPLVFAMMANQYTVSTRRAEALQDKVCLYLSSLNY